MHSFRTLLLLGALSLLALPAAAQQKTLLRQHWEPGKTYHFEANMDMEIGMPQLPGGAQSTNIIQKIDAVVTTDPASGHKHVALQFVSIKAMMNTANKIMNYDSADPAMSEPSLQQAFGALLGKSVTLVYDKDDKFVDVIIPPDFKATPLGAGMGPDGKQFAAMLRDSIDFGLPTEPVAPGDTYTVDKKLTPMPMAEALIKLKGRYDSIVQHEGRKHAKLLLEGTIEMPGQNPAAPGQPVIQPNSKLKLELLFDLERKAMSLTVGSTDMTMNAGSAIHMKQNATTTLKSIEPTPAKK